MTGRLRPFQWKHRYARRLYRIGFVQPYGAGDTEGHAGIEITGIVTRCSSPHGSDFVSLTDDADTMQAPCLEADDTSTEDLARWIRAKEPDAIFCIGWNRILPADIFDIPPRGVIGYHPAALPHNRGRHPIIWALARGLTQTASTFFLMDEGADTGAIVDQEPVPIGADDDAGRLYARLQDMAPDQLQRFVPHLRDGTLVPRPQDPESGNVWRKRTAEDGRIEWRMSATDIHNLVRALATPYPGATCRLDVSDVAIHKVEVVPEAPGESGARQDFERRSVGNSGEMRRRRDPHSRT
ncbi:MAG: formyltransferase family protein [Alphaproteobacteria bacterium]|nr:formyltransferase family protein [Alphaproteobacteria bacterium]